MKDLTGFVAQAWACDHFGHLNVRHYAAAFDDATFLFWNEVGFRHGKGPMPVTLEIKTAFLHEVKAGAVLRIHAGVTKIGTKSTGLCLEMRQGDTVMARAEVIEVFMDPATRSSTPIPDHIRDALTAF